MTLELPLRLIGNPGSPYTRKMVSFLRYKLIPYKIIWGDPGFILDKMEIEKPKPVLHPTFLIKKKGKKVKAVTDSTPIIRMLENLFQKRSTIPSNPVLAFINYLLEDFGDEWGTKFMFHYRWHDKQDIENAGTLLPLTSNPVVSEDALGEMKKQITDRQIGRVWVVGSNKITAPLINSSFKRFLTIMEKHLSQYPFLFGNRPSSADFSFFGQLCQLVGFDPTPRAITHNLSMRTVAWVDKTEDLSGLDPSENDWLSPTSIPNTINLLLSEIGATYVPTMLANEKAFKRGEERWEAKLEGLIWTQRTFPYQVKCLNWVREEYQALTNSEQNEVNALISNTGCEALLK